jgi:uncharacterized protein DUF3576
MYVRYYRLLSAFAASLSLLAAGLTAGCGSDGMEKVDPVTGKMAQAPPKVREPEGMDTEATIFTVFGLAKRESEREIGPQTGDTVSPVLWQAAHDTLDFAGISSEDPITGLLMTDWYSPSGKPNQRLRVSVFILSRALRSDSVTVTVEREERSSTGEWKATPVARDTVAGIENAILLRARSLHAERYRRNM